MMTSILRKRFYFVRHGKTAWNDKHLCQGQIDVELNEAGREQAKQLACFLQSFTFSSIFSSPLKRAFETAQLIQSAQPACPLHLVDDLKERGWGELEGSSSEEMYRIEELEELQKIHAGKGIEPREVFKKRIAQGINFAINQDENALIVSHGRVFLLLCELLNIPLIRQVPNTCLVECLPKPNSWEINYFS